VAEREGQDGTPILRKYLENTALVLG